MRDILIICTLLIAIISLSGCTIPSIDNPFSNECETDFDCLSEEICIAGTCELFTLPPEPKFEWNPATESSLPIVIVNTSGNEIVDEPKVLASMKIINNGTNTIGMADGIAPQRIGIEIRGYSSQFYPKKNYGFETWDIANEDLEISLLGFPAESDWILYGPYHDDALVRNNLSYYLSSEMGHYATQPKFVELFVVDSDKDITESYLGVYALAEKVKRDKDSRIQISKLDSSCTSGACLTGGYILKFGKASETDVSFTTNSGSEVVIEYPNPDNLNSQQEAYITNYINDFETLSADPIFSDPVNGYAKYIDVDSFIDYLVLAELTRHCDGLSMNFFLHKDKSGKLVAGPVWDFDRAFGNTQRFGCEVSEGFLFDSDFDASHAPPLLLTSLMSDTAFKKRLALRWFELRQGILSDSALTNKIDQIYASIGSAKERNFEKWPYDPNYLFVISTGYEDEIPLLKEWTVARATWLDSELRTDFPTEWPTFDLGTGEGLPEKIILDSQPLEVEIDGTITTIDFGGTYPKSFQNYGTFTLFYSAGKNYLSYTTSDPIPGFGERQWSIMIQNGSKYIVLLATQDANAETAMLEGPFAADWSNTKIHYIDTNTTPVTDNLIKENVDFTSFENGFWIN
jgi:hypothetical protein